jgi:hypothetical protein
MDLDRIWDEVMRILATVRPDAFAEASSKIAEVEGFMGFKLREELIASLGGELFLYVAAPKGGGLVPEIVVGLSLKNVETFRKCMDSALRLVADHAGQDFELSKMSYKGREIHFVRLGGNAPVTPSWTIVDGRLLVALMPQTVKSVLRKLDAEEKPASILDNEAFAPGLKRMPANACLVSYTDLPAAFDFVYNLVLPFLPAITSNLEDFPLDISMLPSAESISQHLTPTHAAMWGDDEGITYSAHAPVSLLTAVAAAAPMFLLVAGGSAMAPEPAFRELEPTEEARPRDPDLTNLDEVGAGLLIHYVEQGKYPATFEELVKTRALPDASVLVSPGDEAPRMVGSVKCSYEYVGAAVAKLKGNKHRVVVAWTRSGPRRAVLFLDGGVRRVSETEFQNLLAETRKRMAGEK